MSHSSIEEALEVLRQGKLIILVDNEDRENEGDFVASASSISYESLNEMVRVGRGLVCAPLSKTIAEKLRLEPMVSTNTDLHQTAFTVSVDAALGTTTGISIGDRLKTLRNLCDSKSKNTDFRRPGHIFPLTEVPCGLFKREGHTEASVELMRLAGLPEVSVICEILNEDGTMARLPELQKLASEKNIPLITIEQLLVNKKKREPLVKREASAQLPTPQGIFELAVYSNCLDEKEHLVLVKGEVKNCTDLLVRVHSECFTGDVLGSMRCDCGTQLETALSAVENEGKGVVIYLRQEGRGIGLTEKIKAYRLQEEGLDTVDANLQLGHKPDERDYAVASAILRELGVQSIRLLSNNPEKQKGLELYGTQVNSLVPIEVGTNCHNIHYMETKKKRMGHKLKML